MFTKLTDKQIKNKIDFIDHYIKSENTASASIVDANSNVHSKNVATLAAELNKDINIQVKRQIVYNYIEKNFGKEQADKYIQQIKDHVIYSNDESGVVTPYCVSINIYPFLEKGLTTLGGESKAPKHLASFCGSFVNLMFAISSQFSGAVACPETLSAFDYFCRKDYGDNYLETHRDIIDNELQHVIYALNQPAAARGFQSIFFNLSIFDKYYFDSVLGSVVLPDGGKYNWETLEKLQKHFMKWFNNERTKALLTFPVVTAAILNEEDGSGIKDKEFVDFLSQEMSEGNSFFVYQSESADSLASCCFSKDQKIKVKINNNVIEDTFLNIYSKYNNKELLVFVEDGLYKFGNIVRLPKRKMFKVVTDNNKEMVVSDNHLHPLINSNKDVCTTDLKIGDVLICINEETATITSIEEVIYNHKYIYCFEMVDTNDPYFALSNGIITHNCRLRNAFTSNDFSYSMGAGGIATGSKNVITINMNRLIQKEYDLKEIVQDIHKYQYAINEYFKDLFDAGLLTVYNAGYISLNKQYLTIGINGLVEAAEYKGIDISNNDEYKKFVSDHLKIIFEENKEATKKYNVMFNTEFVPGENLGIKNATWDKENNKNIVVKLKNGVKLYLSPETRVKMVDGKYKYAKNLTLEDDIYYDENE